MAESRASASRIARIGVVAKRHLTGAAGPLGELAAWLAARDTTVVFDSATSALAGALADARTVPDEALPHESDVVVVLGGDGTLLSVANRIGRAGTDTPILGVNFGSLGFLTEVTLPEMFPTLASVLDGTAVVEERAMLQCVVSRGGEPSIEYLVLNEVVITKGVLARMIDLSVWIEDQFVAAFKADGLILATPTGSTAYNLSAGGPIVHPAVDAVVLTPIAPHTLTNRPVVVPASRRVRITPRMRSEQEDVFVTFDGQTGFPLERDHEVAIERAPRPLRLVKAPTRTYFDVLRQKLKWTER
ncbi:MAG: NAD(+)/NADH kinase [Vicinamibacterales bacterium]